MYRKRVSPGIGGLARWSRMPALGPSLKPAPPSAVGLQMTRRFAKFDTPERKIDQFTANLDQLTRRWILKFRFIPSSKEFYHGAVADTFRKIKRAASCATAALREGEGMSWLARLSRALPSDTQLALRPQTGLGVWGVGIGAIRRKRSGAASAFSETKRQTRRRSLDYQQQRMNLQNNVAHAIRCFSGDIGAAPTTVVTLGRYLPTEVRADTCFPQTTLNEFGAIASPIESRVARAPTTALPAASERPLPFQPVSYEFVARAELEIRRRMACVYNEPMDYGNRSALVLTRVLTVLAAASGLTISVTSLAEKFSSIMRIQLLVSCGALSYMGGVAWGYSIAAAARLPFRVQSRMVRTGVLLVVVSAASLWIAGYDYLYGYCLLTALSAGSSAWLARLASAGLVPRWFGLEGGRLLAVSAVGTIVGAIRAEIVGPQAQKQLLEYDVNNAPSLASLVRRLFPSWYKRATESDYCD